MKSIIKYLNLACWAGLSAAVTALAEPTPSPTPTSTPHTEPSASPTPSGTPRKEPTPTPTASPSSTPDGEHGEVSLRGVYGATTPSGGLVVFCIEKNTFVQINMLDVAGQVIGFAEGPLSNGSFSLTLTTGQAIVGTASED